MSCCFGIKARTIVYYVFISAALGYLIYCIIKIPQYRYMAIIIIVLVAAFQVSIWRFFPSERMRIQHKAKCRIDSGNYAA
ncbi:hypothetical protein ADEAN_000833300 [Angomonas deanei]|uniref:Uncharacterized protein n=1 Tax=Angomonas deanei TaxID=59799 RepID=A0A7G2CLT9_9TRYP|nr:hypothetical protein ADEAN_000833300 [Angomonas deanei]